MSEAEISTIRELEGKLKALELEVLGRETEGNGPFTPISSIKRRLDELKKNSEKSSDSSGPPPVHPSASTKLPAIALPSFGGMDFEFFCKEFFRFMRLSSLTLADDQTKNDWLVQAFQPKLRKILESILEKESKFDLVMEELANVFPKVENSISLRQQLSRVPQLASKVSPAEGEQMLLEVETLFSKLPDSSMSEDEKVLLLVSNIHPTQWKEIRAERSWRKRCDTYTDLKALVREKVRDDYAERFLFGQVQKRDQKSYYMDSQGQNFGKGRGKGLYSQNDGHIGGYYGQDVHFQLQEQGKGKGGGRGDSQGKGGAKGGKGKGEPKPPEFKAKIVCKFCKKNWPL